MEVQREDLLASINRAYRNTNSDEMRQALNECAGAVSRAASLEDLAFIRDVYYGVRSKELWQAGIVSRMTQASTRLEAVKLGTMRPRGRSS